MPQTVVDLTTRSVISGAGRGPTQVVTTVPDSPRIRLCERCWLPLSTGTVFRVFRHPEPFSTTPATDEDGTVLEPLSFRHLDDDPICSGAQVAEDTERVA